MRRPLFGRSARTPHAALCAPQTAARAFLAHPDTQRLLAAAARASDETPGGASERTAAGQRQSAPRHDSDDSDGVIRVMSRYAGRSAPGCG